MTSPAPVTSAAPNPPRWLLKLVAKLHVILNRLTFGRMFNTLAGDEVCFVTMTGAKSGRRITVALMYVPYGNCVLLLASMGGAPKNPVWYHSVAKNPAITVKYRGKKMALHARLAKSEEKPSLWPVCDSVDDAVQRLKEQT